MLSDRADVMWLAGLYEGEGCVVSDKRGGSLKLRIGMTDRDVLVTFQELAQGGYISPRSRDSGGLGKKPVWDYVATGRHAYAVFIAMFPFLHQRRRNRIHEKLTVWLTLIPSSAGRSLRHADVRVIKRELDSGGHGTGRRLAKQYGVSDATISAIRVGRIWKSVA